MLILDYSQICHAAIYQFEDDLRDNTEDVLNLFRHSILSTIKFYKKKFKEYSSEIVIACDGRSYWRKEIFPHYKASRKKNREDRNLPWDKIFSAIDQMAIDISENFPYKVIRIDKAEADDIMAVIVEEICNKRLIQNGLETESEPVLMVSTDKDMSQLQKYSNVSQYSPFTQKFIKLECSPKEFLRRLILSGDRNDSITNIFSHENSFVNKIRQTPCTEAKMKPFLEAKNMFEVSNDPEINRRLILNARLISFDFIPRSLKKSIVDQYNNTDIIGNKEKIYRYLAKNKCYMLIDDIESF